MIDLRSDTVTRPVPEMLRAMWDAPVGDDVFDEDPTVNRLQQKAAEMFGMEEALFCPSGTMTNQIALKIHTQPGDEIICHEYSHIYNYEGGGMAFNAGCQPRLLHGPRGLMQPSEVAAKINRREDIHAARTSLVAVENTSNKGGGACYDWPDLRQIADIAELHKLGLHLDGARLFNALIARNQHAADYGGLFHTISICLSKGLGCPVGSLLLGSREMMREAKRVRKKFGGGMRQAGYLAAAGIYALDHHIHRLAEDHEKAAEIEAVLRQCAWVRDIEKVETNIVIFYLRDLAEKDFLHKLQDKGILGIGMGDGKMRLVTHLDFSYHQLQTVKELLLSV